MGKKNKTYEPTAEEKEGAPQAFLYELKMFHYSVQQYKGIQLFKNTVLESALLHARNLLDFFNCDRSHKDDICACHFVKDPPKVAYVETLREDINKSLSHLTYSRLTPGREYVWNLKKIQDDIDRAYANFIRLLPGTEKANWKESLDE